MEIKSVECAIAKETSLVQSVSVASLPTIASESVQSQISMLSPQLDCNYCCTWGYLHCQYNDQKWPLLIISTIEFCLLFLY